MHALLEGIIAGLAVAIPLGAIGVLIIQRAVEHGFVSGAAAGLGTATADAAYATLAVTVGAAVGPAIAEHATALHWAAAVVLMVVAVVLARPVWSRGDASVVAAPPDARAASPLRSYAMVLGLTLANPTTVIYFAALAAGPALGAHASGASRAAFVAGVLLGSAVWQVVLAAVGAGFRSRLLTPTARRWTAGVGAALVVVLALRSAIAA
ncbi:LysE family transporter [Demequina litorisediminis]|uniref:Arginine exporter protein ArgO n=1 Tax=Demequina litorisediminis TaxID=1849022 RepID=A0ABQ6ID03_9MICO|nr:LysE family transporter [Demequina litorisediminis]GMA35723.1 hypothetical protein GCM10025876_19270 [Demequina litorisediminis]